jgi:hypothetical protein
MGSGDRLWIILHYNGLMRNVYVVYWIISLSSADVSVP